MANPKIYAVSGDAIDRLRQENVIREAIGELSMVEIGEAAMVRLDKHELTVTAASGTNHAKQLKALNASAGGNPDARLHAGHAVRPGKRINQPHTVLRRGRVVSLNCVQIARGRGAAARALARQRVVRRSWRFWRLAGRGRRKFL